MQDDLLARIPARAAGTLELMITTGARWAGGSR